MSRLIFPALGGALALVTAIKRVKTFQVIHTQLISLHLLLKVLDGGETNRSRGDYFSVCLKNSQAGLCFWPFVGHNFARVLHQCSGMFFRELASSSLAAERFPAATRILTRSATLSSQQC